MKIKIKDVFVNYEKRGSGFPVLMLHGWGVDHRLLSGALEPVFQMRERDYCRYYIDLPGMGLSDASDNINGSDDMIEYIQVIISELIGNDSFLLIGNSYGGYLARALVRIMPQKIAGLLLHVPAFKPYKKTENGFDKGDVPDHIVVETDAPFMLSLSESEKQAFSHLSVRQTNDAWQKFKDCIAPGIECANHDFLENNLGKNVEFKVDPDVMNRPYGKPVLIVTGRQDSAAGYKGIYSILDNYPRATFAILDGCGHNLQTERSQLFEQLVEDWLDRIEV
ncbi:MAG: alpha/beta hydrolase [Spirochaetes bacterium]|nr:alpha/beta hydrolase [Spirochaetota bacterium]MBN2771444.1 alpha/beta hydrolase [Spirochaetota bacterium]